MKRILCGLLACLVLIFLLAACQEASSGSAAPKGPEAFKPPSFPLKQADLLEELYRSYYAGQSVAAYEYFQHASIQKFLKMWVAKETGDLEAPVWNLDSFTQIAFLDHDFVDLCPKEKLYCCTFSDGADRTGYAIVRYQEEDPSLSNWGIKETTPYLYDFRANREQIMAALLKTDLDIASGKACRVYLYDTNNQRADQVIRFTDGKGGNYTYAFGDPAHEMVKW